MGLESAELMLAIEERYAFEIDEEDVKDVETFGDLCDMVKRNIDKTPSHEETEASYDIILAVLLAELRKISPPQMEIDENTKWPPFPSQMIQERFPELDDSMCIYMPAWYGWMWTLVAFATCGSWIWLLKLIEKNSFSWFSTGLCLILVLLTCFLISNRGWKSRTIGYVAAEITRKRQNRLRAPTLSSEEIESELREIICEQFGVREPEKITRETDLVKDLGLG